MNKRCVALIGNPNCGKTTLFNALTGATQRVGNWPGVTVERKSGSCKAQQTQLSIVDLPGVYSLNLVCKEHGLDEKVACDYLFSEEADVIVNVIDGSNLERNLYLTVQLLEMGLPMLVAVNMLDVAKRRGITVDLAQLEKKLGCSVVGIQSNKGKGIKALKQAIISHTQQPTSGIGYSTVLEEAIETVTRCCPETLTDAKKRCLAIRGLEEDRCVVAELAARTKEVIAEQQAHIQQCLGEDVDILFADGRYQFIQQLASKVACKQTPKRSLSECLDKIALNRVLGIPIFFAVMYSLFLFSINIAGALQDFFDISSHAVFVQGFAELLHHWHFPHWLVILLANGIGTGINTVLTFIPVIGGMFLFLSFLEDCGYMARAAFVMDRFMQAIGLPGKSFVPMIVGFGCNVPAIMGARILENKRDRILTVMMSPFMSCSARLAIFALFSAAFFPVGGQNIVFGLYLIGIAFAILTGLFLRKTLLAGKPAPMIMELPPYHLPRLRSLLTHTWNRLRYFLFKAGKIILPLCVVIGALNGITLANKQTALSAVGKTLAPIFRPLGIRQENWPATVGLITGVLAKEVVVGTLNALYTETGHLKPETLKKSSVTTQLKIAWASVATNFRELGHALGNPIAASESSVTFNKQIFGQMYQRFDGKIGAFAYLLFVLLYFPCISATAAIAREISTRWACFSVLWTTGLAYSVSVIFYQLATYSLHPLQSLLWVGVLTSLAVGLLVVMRRHAAEVPLSAGGMA